MRLSRAAIGGLLCLAALGCGSTVQYIPIQQIDRTSPPVEVELLAESPQREYTALGFVRMELGSYPERIQLSEHVIEAYKREAARHGADAVIVPFTTKEIPQGDSRGSRPSRYIIDGLAIAWNQATTHNQAGATQSDSRGDSLSSPRPGKFVKADEQPVELYRQAPKYPEAAGMAGLSGTVWVQALVGTNGRVEQARILKPSGSNVGFEGSALEAAYQNRFRPAMLNGKPIAVWISYKVDFTFRH